MVIEVLNLHVSLILNNAEPQALDTRPSLSASRFAIQETIRPRKALQAIELVLNTIAATATSVLHHLGDMISSENQVGSWVITYAPLLILSLIIDGS